MKTYAKEDLEQKVKISHSFKNLLKNLGTGYGPNSLAVVKREVFRHGIDTSHFDRFFLRRSLSPRKAIEKTCSFCGKIYLTKDYVREKKFCSSECARKNVSPETRLKRSLSLKKRIKDKGLFGPLGLTGEQVPRIERKCPACGTVMRLEPSKSHRIFCSRKCFLSDKDFLFKNKPSGGVRDGSGTGNSGKYKGFYCASTYELAYLIYCLDNSVTIKRNKEGFPYQWNGKTHLYYPDFIVNGEYVEIKGYNTPQFEAKKNSLPFPLKVLYKKDLVFAFDHVKNKYGVGLKRISDLYE
jgi:endogenous inhibitor of DNA gyrase (YacG/DUF329 family)